MIIWSGWGFLTALIAVVFVGLAAGPAVETGLPYNLCLSVGLAAGALTNFLVARWLSRRPTRELIDARSGQRFVLRDRSSLFFIPVRFWTYALLVLAVATLVMAPVQPPPPKGATVRAAVRSVGI